MNLNIHPPLPERKDWRIGCVGSGFIMSDCHLVAYGKAGFNPAAIASRTAANAAACAERHSIGIPEGVIPLDMEYHMVYSDTGGPLTDTDCALIRRVGVIFAYKGNGIY